MVIIMNSNDIKAKEILKKYNYSKFLMGRESMKEYTEYKNYKISDAQEETWIDEYQSELINKCYSSENPTVFHKCFLRFSVTKSDYPTINNLKELIELINYKKDKLDSFTKMRLGEDALDLIVKAFIKKGFTNEKVIIELKKLAVEILSDVISKPVVVDSEYSLSDSISNNALLPENILNRAKSALNEWS